MPHYHRRAATAKELETLAKKLESQHESYGCATIFCLFVPAAVLYFVGGALGSIISDAAARIGGWTLPILAVALYVAVLRQMIRASRRRRDLFQKDLNHQEVEEFRVSAADVGLIGAARQNRNNALVFALPDRRILFLQLTPELFEPKTYGANGEVANAKGEVVNRLAAPYSFPSTDFVIRRFPQSGELIGIDVAGEYAAPRQLSPGLRNHQLFRPSEIFAGTIDNVAEVIEMEQAQRKRAETQL